MTIASNLSGTEMRTFNESEEDIVLHRIKIRRIEG